MQDSLGVGDVSINNNNLVGEITSKSQYKLHIARNQARSRTFSLSTQVVRVVGQGFLGRWSSTWGKVFMGGAHRKALLIFTKTN